MHYLDTGLGTPLVLLHAFPLDNRMWDGVRGSLSAHVRVITPDQRGLGRSPLADGSADLDLVAADLVLLLEELNLERVVLGGCSMGGYVAMSLLATAPERIAGLVLIDTKATADDREARAKRLELAARAEAEGNIDWLADAVLPSLLGRTTMQSRHDVVETVRGFIAGQPAEGVAWAQRAMANRSDSTELLRTTNVPTLVAHGEEDALIPVSTAAEMAALLPEGEFVTLPSTGHLPSVETPQELTRVLLRWLGATGLV